MLGPGQDLDRADALLQTRSPRKLVDRLLESAATSSSRRRRPPTARTPRPWPTSPSSPSWSSRPATTRRREVLDACAQLESMGTPVLGAVIVAAAVTATDGRSVTSATRRRLATDEPLRQADVRRTDRDASPGATAVDGAPVSVGHRGAGPTAADGCRASPTPGHPPARGGPLLDDAGTSRAARTGGLRAVDPGPAAPRGTRPGWPLTALLVLLPAVVGARHGHAHRVRRWRCRWRCSCTAAGRSWCRRASASGCCSWSGSWPAR